MNLFNILEEITERPEPFEHYTAIELWTDPHTSAQMLANHLNPDIDVSSRRAEFIDRSVAWIRSRFNVGPGTRIADFGCGPGLYANRLAGCGAQVTGIDFSSRSIEYARGVAAESGLDVDYRHGDYLEFNTDLRFDLILMIFCDFCALGPVLRRTLLEKFRTLLAPGGSVLLDVCSLGAFAEREESLVFQENMLDGFWAPGKYYGFLSTLKYEEARVVLDKYTIAEPGRTRRFYNWLQYFSPDSLKQEFERAGFTEMEILGNVAGDPLDASAPEFAIVAGIRESE